MTVILSYNTVILAWHPLFEVAMFVWFIWNCYVWFVICNHVFPSIQPLLRTPDKQWRITNRLWCRSVFQIISNKGLSIPRKQLHQVLQWRSHSTATNDHHSTARRSHTKPFIQDQQKGLSIPRKQLHLRLIEEAFFIRITRPRSGAANQIICMQQIIRISPSYRPALLFQRPTVLQALWQAINSIQFIVLFSPTHEAYALKGWWLWV